MNEKHQQDIYNADINVNLMEENVIQIKGGSTTKVDLSAKAQENIICAIKMIFGVQVHVLVKMVNTWKILLIIQSICDEIIDAIRSEPTKYVATTTRKKP